MRRLVQPHPIASARLARFLAVFGLRVVLISSVLLWFGLVSVIPGLVALASGLVVALLAILCALFAFLLIWRTGFAGFGRAMAGFALAMLLVVPPMIFAAYAIRMPWLVDITTDTADPPQFAAALEDRPRDANPLLYDERTAGQQITAYPSIRSLLIELPPEDTHARILQLVHDRKWRLLAETAPTGAGSTGRVEAVAQSILPGLQDDVVIRVREQGALTRVDMRSAARYGHLDAGANAKRILSFLTDLRTLSFAEDPATQ